MRTPRLFRMLLALGSWICAAGAPSALADPVAWPTDARVEGLRWIVVLPSGKSKPFTGSSSLTWEWESPDQPPQVRLSLSQGDKVEALRYKTLPDVVQFGTTKIVMAKAETTALRWTHPSCQELSMEMVALQDTPTHGLGAVRCARTSDHGVQVTIALPEDVKLAQMTIPGEKKRTDSRVVLEIPDSKIKSDASAVYGTIEWESKTSRQKGRIALCKRRTEKKRYTFSFSMGPSYLSYSEPTSANLVNEVGLTTKVDGRYSAIPGKLDLSAYFFITALPLGGTPESGGLPRYYGLGTRAGYWVPIAGGRYLLQFGVGWYIWGMLVPDSSYGIAQIMGPQFMVVLVAGSVSSKRIGGYLKFAPIGSSASQVVAGNHEFAGGFFYELARISQKFPLNFTLDVSQVYASSPDNLYQAYFISISPALQISF